MRANTRRHMQMTTAPRGLCFRFQLASSAKFSCACRPRGLPSRCLRVSSARAIFRIYQIESCLLYILKSTSCNLIKCHFFVGKTVHLSQYLKTNIDFHKKLLDVDSVQRPCFYQAPKSCTDLDCSLSFID